MKRQRDTNNKAHNIQEASDVSLPNHSPGSTPIQFNPRLRTVKDITQDRTTRLQLLGHPFKLIPLCSTTGQPEDMPAWPRLPGLYSLTQPTISKPFHFWVFLALLCWFHTIIFPPSYKTQCIFQLTESEYITHSFTSWCQLISEDQDSMFLILTAHFEIWSL